MNLYFNNVSGVKAETKKAVLIKVANTGEAFWQPKKLTYPTDVARYSIAYIPENFVTYNACSDKHEVLNKEYLELMFEETKRHFQLESSDVYHSNTNFRKFQC